MSQWVALQPIFEVCTRETSYEGGGGGVGTHGGVKRRQRHILGQPWSKYCGKQGVGAGVRGTRSRVWEETVGGGRFCICRYWNGDGKHPGGRMTPCGGWILWDGYGRRPGGQRTPCMFG